MKSTVFETSADFLYLARPLNPEQAGEHNGNDPGILNFLTLQISKPSGKGVSP
jgi:hypothetical protein